MYSKLIELIRNNIDYIEYDSEIDPQSHLVILFDKDAKEKDITDVEVIEGHIIMETKFNTMELSMGEDELLKMIEFR